MSEMAELHVNEAERSDSVAVDCTVYHSVVFCDLSFSVLILYLLSNIKV